MNEDFLHYVWKFQKFSPSNLQTTQGESLVVEYPGDHNQHSGPDFMSAKVKLGSLVWIGNVEIHWKTSDWFLHRHHSDPAYDSLILHVVWEDDVELFRLDGSPMPTLELSSRVNPKQYDKYHQFLSRPPQFIPCEKELQFFPSMRCIQLKERMYIERLSEKATRIQAVLHDQHNDWEGTLFVLLAGNFGLNVNGDSFFQIASSIPFRTVQKLRQSPEDLEALFLGQSNLLSSATNSGYEKNLWERFCYLKHKFRCPLHRNRGYILLAYDRPIFQPFDGCSCLNYTASYPIFLLLL